MKPKIDHRQEAIDKGWQVFEKDDEVPEELELKIVFICRSDLDDNCEYKIMPVYGFRIEQIQNGVDPYPIDWWAFDPSTEQKD